MGNFIVITQLTSMKSILGYSFINQIRYAIGGITIVDSNDGYANTITYMFFCISMNLETFACIVLFVLHTKLITFQIIQVYT